MELISRSFLLTTSQVNGLIESYLSSERTIILAIVPANQDVATVDILERAKKVRSDTACPIAYQANTVMIPDRFLHATALFIVVEC